MRNVRGNLKLAIVIALSLLLTACATPINRYGEANRDVVNELLQTANDVGFENTTKASHDCPVPFDCPATQSHSAMLQIPANGRSNEDGCRMLIDFAGRIGARNFLDTQGVATPVASDDAMTVCTDAIGQGLDEKYLADIDQIESFTMHVPGTKTTANKIHVPYFIQFNSYLKKDGERGFMLYISANSEEFPTY
ncbi:MAG: hypothetical protein RLZ71_323 [Actinomycetota bacterium]|jgi:hypothetical protein